MITKFELIEYLKHTPENTNYNILYSSLYNGSNKEVVDEFIEALSRGNLSLAALQPYLAKLYEDDKTISPDPLPPFSSGGSSVPKPLTYDYMPEGYPSKSVQATTLMEEQELTFAEVANGIYGAFMDTPLDIVGGQTYTVTWDGAEYECTCVDDGKTNILGNTSIFGNGIDTGEPFLYDYNQKAFATLDTSASHTISVKRVEETVTPMAEEFIPNIPADKLPAGGVTTLHINVTAVNFETMEATFTADKTPAEMAQAAVNGPVWCVVTFEAGIFGEEAVTISAPPAWNSGRMAFGESINPEHNANGYNTNSYFVMQRSSDNWTLDITQFGG